MGAIGEDEARDLRVAFAAEGVIVRAVEELEHLAARRREVLGRDEQVGVRSQDVVRGRGVQDAEGVDRRRAHAVRDAPRPRG